MAFRTLPYPTTPPNYDYEYDYSRDYTYTDYKWCLLCERYTRCHQQRSRAYCQPRNNDNNNNNDSSNNNNRRDSGSNRDHRRCCRYGYGATACRRRNHGSRCYASGNYCYYSRPCRRSGGLEVCIYI